jgi:histidinol phosphatase-like enzyme
MRAVFLDRDGTLVEEVPYLHESPQRAVYLGKHHFKEHRQLTGSGP